MSPRGADLGVSVPLSREKNSQEGQGGRPKLNNSAELLGRRLERTAFSEQEPARKTTWEGILLGGKPQQRED